MCASIISDANELTLGGKSAQDVFKDEGVAMLLKAVINRDVSTAKRLIAGGVNINTLGEKGITPLLWVELNRDTDAMKLLLNLGADPNKYVLPGIGERGVGPAVWLAAGAGQKEILQILLDHGGDPNLVFGNDSPLMMAIGASHLDCAELLLQHGADINYSAGPHSRTAFDMAIGILQYDLVLWVLNHGYTYDLPMARRGIVLEHRKTRPGQEIMKEQALEIIDHLLATQKK